MIKLVVFNLWNTLAYKNIESAPEYKIKEKLGIKANEEDFKKRFEEIMCKKEWKTKQEVYENLCEELEIPREKSSTIKEIMDDAEEKISVYNDSIDILRQLKEQNYETAIISNSWCFDVKKLKNDTEIFDYIDYELFSFDIGDLKPGLKLFYKTLEITGYKPPEIAMIGDKDYEDIIPAKEAGFYAVQFKDYEQLKKDLSQIGVFLD